MNANVSKLLNEQINKEFYSAYLYLDFANYYASVGLDGFENWYRVQAQEERDHAMLLYQYLQNNGEGVTFEAIAKPEWERGGHMTPLKKALEHEKLVTASIDAIYAAAYEAKDFRAMQMLDWFIKEQGEEEKNAADELRCTLGEHVGHRLHIIHNDTGDIAEIAHPEKGQRQPLQLIRQFHTELVFLLP